MGALTHCPEELKGWLFIQHINCIGIYRRSKIQELNTNTPQKVWSLHFFLFTTIPTAPLSSSKPHYRRPRNFLIYTSQKELLSVTQTKVSLAMTSSLAVIKNKYMLAVCPCIEQSGQDKLAGYSLHAKKKRKWKPKKKFPTKDPHPSVFL